MRSASTVFVASVWLVHGGYNKLLHGSPRHLAIVQSVPGFGGAAGEHVLTAVGVFEIALAVWVLSGWAARLCAATQTIALLSMNVVELSVARDLLLWPAGLIPLNLGFLALAWIAAASRKPGDLLAPLRRHPLAIDAHLEHCLTLTYALPPHVLRPLLPPGLELETFGGYGFVAIALVRARSLRPAGLPAAVGRDFFLAGYRIFTTFRRPTGGAIRGLKILRSDTNRAPMVVGGNLLTHYNYHRCEASIDASADRIHAVVQTSDGAGDLDLTADLTNPALPPGSPFSSIRDARRFAGPLPFTFDYESATNSIIAINAARTNWRPTPVAVTVGRLAFFNQPAFSGCTPLLAAAFHVERIDYRWARGVRYPLGRDRGEYQGLGQIVRFNWPFYAFAIGAILAAALVSSGLPIGIHAHQALSLAIGLALMWIVGSLAVSWIVYDASPLMRWEWIRDAIGFHPRTWINIHAGLDESTHVLRRMFGPSDGRAFDIFDPLEMTEPSIARARRLAHNVVEPEHVDFRRLPVDDRTLDAAMLLLSAHELRTHDSRCALFAELHRALAPGGRVVVAEHLRDVANVAAFGPGALHFHSRRTWKRCFAQTRLAVEREFSMTPFVRVFVLRRVA